MSGLFFKILYQPLFNALIFLYENISFYDFGIAIIILTILIRLILFPLFFKGAKDQAILQRLAPKIREIQKNHKHDKEKQTKAILEVYKEHKVNPFSNFLLILIQLPILIALYRVFLQGFSSEAVKDLYSFIPPPASIDHFFLGIIDLSKTNFIIAIVAALIQFLQSRLLVPKNTKPFNELSTAEKMGQQMLFIGPLLTFFFLYFLNLPSAIGIYWLTTSLFSVIQQLIINKSLRKMDLK